MDALRSERFDEFFQTLYGYGPFPWQRRLAHTVADARPGQDSWPEALALPTAAGKTACIDIAVFALACQADRPVGERVAPRRIFFVVDRRVIVDQAYERALSIRRRLLASTSGILKLVADRLRALASANGSSDDYSPLECFQLRGGIYRDDAWARTPLQPTVIASTVDQIGSRLLFRGYGLRSGSLWPVHAGLAGNDTLIILDEAHCAVPFMQTAAAVARYREWALSDEVSPPLRSPFRVAVLSATPPDGVRLFGLNDEDLANAVLGARVTASKPATLQSAGPGTKKEAIGCLAEQIAKEALGLASGKPLAVGVMVNRVATAREVFRRIVGEGHDAVLLTGRMRPIDRDATVRGRLELLTTGKERNLEQPLFVVATQCLEVGADLDFDGLVTECASLDALRQRFGRLNRAGRDIPAKAVIVIRADQADAEKGDPDPVYGMALAETWQWLKSKARHESIDMGVAALEQLLPSDAKGRASLNAPVEGAPVMLPAHVDCWAQTCPIPLPEPEVTLFLHGPGRGAPEVQVCWRADLGPASDSDWVEAVGHCPPSSPECMPVPLYVLRGWLRGDEVGSSLSDVEGGKAEEVDGQPAAPGRRVLRWLGPDDSEVISDGRLLRPGDTVVIPASLQGWEVFGHIPPGPDGQCVTDVGDRANWTVRGVPVLMIRSAPSSAATTTDSWPACEPRDELQRLAVEMARQAGTLEDQSEIRRLLRALAECAGQDGTRRWLQEIALALAEDRRLNVTVHRGGLVLKGQRVRRKPSPDSLLEETLTTEDDSSSATVEVLLDDHARGVRATALQFAAGAGLPDELAQDVALAGLLHDFGKADPRFQALLHGGSLWAAQAAGILLAKSGGMPQSRQARDRARRESGYPRGGRHELLSVRLAEGDGASGLLSKAHDRDLVLHLIASHHGRCRPFAPVVEDTAPVPVSAEVLDVKVSGRTDTGLERLNSGVSERFWRLVRKYGWWGLAYLEAILRLADHRCSEAEQDTRLGGAW